MRGELAICQIGDGHIHQEAVVSNLSDIQSGLDRLALLAGDEGAELNQIIDEVIVLREMGTEASVIISDNLRSGSFSSIAFRRRTAIAGLPAGRNASGTDVSAGRFLVMMHPRENVWDYDAMGRFVADVREIAPDATGIPMTHYESLDAMRDAFVLMMSLAIVFIAIITILTFRMSLM